MSSTASTRAEGDSFRPALVCLCLPRWAEFPLAVCLKPSLQRLSPRAWLCRYRLWFDHFGRLWIQTDQVGDGSGDWQKIGSNTMLCADPNTREIRRFLTSPPRCEVTGVITTPDSRSMFVGIQHPGEESRAGNPTEFSDWPKTQFGGPGGRPRSAVLVITRIDGGIIGA